MNRDTIVALLVSLMLIVVVCALIAYGMLIKLRQKQGLKIELKSNADFCICLLHGIRILLKKYRSPQKTY